MVREAAIAALREHMRTGSLCPQPAQPVGTPLSGPQGTAQPEGTTQPGGTSLSKPQGTAQPVSALKEVASGVVVEMRHFLMAISKIRPSVSEKVSQGAKLAC